MKCNPLQPFNAKVDRVPGSGGLFGVTNQYDFDKQTPAKH